jgi:putative nucleotidyltransferase with HDIG domain
LLTEASEHDRAGRITAAIAAYESCVAQAEQAHDAVTLAEALRLLAIAHHRRLDSALARSLCDRSRATAESAGETLLAAKALNTLAAFDLADGQIEAAQAGCRAALASAGDDAPLRGRIEQNLGIIANIQGDLPTALTHYRRSLDAFAAVNDERGCAMAYNSLGMISADQQRWAEADAFLQRSIELTTRLGDVYLRAVALLNHTEVHVANSRFDAALRGAEEALRIFNQLGVERNKSDAYRAIGVVYRATGRVVLAESRLNTAIDIATTAGAVLERAEACRELAELYRQLGRNLDSLRLLNTARDLFRRLEARVDMVDVVSRVEDLEQIFLEVVLEWGDSIESIDSYTHGHCERVAAYAAAVARELGLDEHTQTTIRLGAYLHDLGKVRVPHEILNKPGSLTAEELTVMRRHPIHGVELLADVEFPWDIKPIIRWHHERYDGGGYPDGLRGDAIPLSAQIICVVDVFDALTTSRSYRVAMSSEAALAVIRRDRSWWSPAVYSAFLRAMERMTEQDPQSRTRVA